MSVDLDKNVDKGVFHTIKNHNRLFTNIGWEQN